MDQKTPNTIAPSNEPATLRVEKPRKKLAFVVRTGVKAGIIICRH